MSGRDALQKNQVSEMDQLPAEPSFVGRSALFDVDTSDPALAEQSRVQLSEHALLGHLVLRGSPAILGNVRSVLGIALPEQPLSSVESNNHVMRWVSPDEWLLTVPGPDAFDIERRLREASYGHCAIVNVSGGQTVIEIAGPCAELVLRKSSPTDFHLDVFPVGKVVGAVLAKSQALVRRTGTESFELVIRRSFAHYIWRWLRDASKEYGLRVTS